MHIIYGLMNRWIIEPVEIGTPQNIHELLNWDEQGEENIPRPMCHR